MPDLFALPLVFVLAAAISAIATYLGLPYLRRLTASQHVREDVPESHLEKAGTPSMGGIPMLLAVVVAAILAGWLRGELSVRLLSCLGLILAFAAVGFLDDYRKLGNVKSKGILARWRIAAEIVFAGLFVAATHTAPEAAGAPGWIGLAGWPDWLAAAIGVFVIVGSGNAFNLTDGLDGLASGLTAIAALAAGIACYWLGIGDMALLSFIIAGGAAGFLVLNAKPAWIWMGDVGSLGLGAAMAAIAVGARIEFLYAAIALVFISEALSVIMQVISFKSTGKRIFRMAPLHHHFELGGLSEMQVVSRFWTTGAICAVAGLALLWSALK